MRHQIPWQWDFLCWALLGAVIIAVLQPWTRSWILKVSRGARQVYQRYVYDVLLFAGVALLLFGINKIHPASAWIAGGILVSIYAFLMERGRGPTPRT